jgi:uncharacterized integral membrane protein
MVSWWILIVCIAGAFTFGVLIMAMLQFSRMRDDVARSQERKLDLNGIHPLDSPSQA